MDVAAWLRDLGLERYASLFRDHKIDWDVLDENTPAHNVELVVATVFLRKIRELPARPRSPS